MTEPGLIHIVEFPKHPTLTEPKYVYGPMEILDRDKREVAKEAMNLLWDAMDLSHQGGGIKLPGSPPKEVSAAYQQLYDFVGTMLLGDDNPSHEELC